MQVARTMDGSLTATIHGTPNDLKEYADLVALLEQKVGRLLNDKMPTGVAVSSAMNHGGPFPATGHPGFTAVGIPASIRRFTALQCYDAIRPHRLPPALLNKSPNPKLARLVDGVWITGDIPG